MQQLTGLDAAFLALETPSVYGHVGSVCVLDPTTATEPLTLERLTQLVSDRLHLVPPFRRRLASVPLGLDQPYWFEDPDFDIECHVRELALPAPGDDHQLAEQAARLHARQLDRRRPLWELYLISGLRGGRLAIYTKVHHAAIDGVSGNDILAALLDLTPEGRDVGTPPPWECDQEPSGVGLLARSAVSFARQPLRRDHDALPPRPLVAAVPVSVRTEEQQGALGNRVSSMLAPLPTHLDDPVERLNAAHEAMRAAKEQHGALPADLLADVTQFA